MRIPSRVQGIVAGVALLNLPAAIHAECSSEANTMLEHALALTGDERRAGLAKAVEEHPDCWRIHNELGLVLEQLRQPTAALASYRKAIESDQSAPHPFHGLGDVQFAAGNCREAVRAYTEYLLRLTKQSSLPTETANQRIKICRKKIGGSEDFLTQEEVAIRFSSRALALGAKAIHVEVGAADVSGDVLFDFDSTAIRDAGRPQLREISEGLTSTGAQSTRLRLEGHTDSQGSEEYNQALSEKRAASVRDELVSLGVDADRVEVVGFGESRLKAVGDEEWAHSQNRRVEIRALLD